MPKVYLKNREEMEVTEEDGQRAETAMMSGQPDDVIILGVERIRVGEIKRVSMTPSEITHPTSGQRWLCIYHVSHAWDDDTYCDCRRARDAEKQALKDMHSPPVDPIP